MGHTTNRREFMRLGALAAGFGASTPARRTRRERMPIAHCGSTRRSGATPVLRRELWADAGHHRLGRAAQGPGDFLVRVRSRDGAEGLAAGHPDVLETTWPILTKRVAPFFIGKDARDLESLVDGVYLANSNYKWQGLPFWVPVASVEIAILDLLGKVARQAARRAARRRRPARHRRLSRQRQPRQLAGGGDRVPAAARRRDRRARRSSSASARACGSTTPRRGATWR